MQMYTDIDKAKFSESVEYPGYLVTYHPKPEELEPKEWYEILRKYYTNNGKIILHLLAAVQFERDPFDPYPLESKVKQWGIDVIWRKA